MLDSDDFHTEDVLSFGAGANLYVKIKKERKKQIRISLRLSQAEENSLRMYIYA